MGRASATSTRQVQGRWSGPILLDGNQLAACLARLTARQSLVGARLARVSMKTSTGVRSLLARFTAVLVQLFATTVLYNEKYYNLAAALRNDSEITDDESFRRAYFQIDFNFSWLLASSILCNVMEIGTMTWGHPSQSSIFNMSAFVLHVIGLIATVFMLVQPWPIFAYSIVFLLCSALPLVISALFMVDRVVLRSSLLRRVEVRI